jgi:hypothetical protein
MMPQECCFQMMSRGSRSQAPMGLKLYSSFLIYKDFGPTGLTYNLLEFVVFPFSVSLQAAERWHLCRHDITHQNTKAP